ncbi:MAG TPA: hypothetical protein VN679_10170 [Candidatus Acidoferrales bacterium]|nr:hypothetical protein [Candidatus Acidoferrales bacterium]
MYIKQLLRTLVVCLPLAFGSLAGVPMCPEDIEELMSHLNRPKATVTIPSEAESGDGGVLRNETDLTGPQS